MKFKTVSEFIHALEVEGKKFEHPNDPMNYFVSWDNTIGVTVRSKHDPIVVSPVGLTFPNALIYDWQEYHPEPETEEIELEEWLALDGAHYFLRWVEKGATLPLKEAFKTGATRKVKVPK